MPAWRNPERLHSVLFHALLTDVAQHQDGVWWHPKAAEWDIVIMVSSLHRLTEENIKWLFTDRHAYLQAAQFYDSIEALDVIDWPMLRERNFRRDPNRPDSFERYQAEALVYGHLPIKALLGLVCYDDVTSSQLRKHIAQRGSELKVVTRPKWYF
jgi:ssDNA thymidine ADP-ribosyltransferase, DarT